MTDSIETLQRLIVTQQLEINDLKEQLRKQQELTASTIKSLDAQKRKTGGIARAFRAKGKV